MVAHEPLELYHVEYSVAVKRRLRELSRLAIARGDGDAFLAALKSFTDRLPVYPQFGEPLSDLEVGRGQTWLGIIRPLSMRYGVNEDLRIVFCASPPPAADGQAYRISGGVSRHLTVAAVPDTLQAYGVFRMMFSWCLTP